jgi:hypothetical protein
MSGLVQVLPGATINLFLNFTGTENYIQTGGTTTAQGVVSVAGFYLSGGMLNGSGVQGNVIQPFQHEFSCCKSCSSRDVE